MKKLILILALSTATLLAQNAAPAPVKSEIVTRIIEVKRNTVDNILNVVRSLYPITMTGDSSRKLIIISGQPAIVDAVAETIARLDIPAADTLPSPNVEMTVHLLYASAKADPNAKVPAELEATVRQLRTQFPHASYRVLDTLMLRGRDGRETADSGTLPGSETIYELRYTSNVAPGPAPRTVRLRDLRLSVRMKVVSGTFKGDDGKVNQQFQYQSTGLQTDLDAREGQRTVVGKSNVTGTDDSIFLVVSPKVIE